MPNAKFTLTIETTHDGKCCDKNCSQIPLGLNMWNAKCIACGKLDWDEDLQGWKRPQKCVDAQEEYER